ncbi:MAG: hypothetical protein K5Q00_06360 [Gammaproteobacteria bacterium]|nr:hypothetical protein [Gammaproteobacteria bacterium]
MSGSGGSGYSGGGQEYQINCENLVIDTQLSSPKEDVILKINVGDILEVGLQKSNQTSIVVVLFQNEIAGGVASPQLSQLRSCLEAGTTYIAKVQSINGGQVKVTISVKR